MAVYIYIYMYVYSHIHTYIHTMEYYSVIKNEILALSTTWMDLEGIMLGEISQTKTNTISCHLCGKIENKTNKQTQNQKYRELPMGGNQRQSWGME